MVVFERGNEKNNDVLLVGTVDSIKSGNSKNGNKYTRIDLRDTRYDEALEMEVEDTATIIFLDRYDNGSGYGDQLNSTNVNKLKIKAGSIIAVRCSRVTNDDGEVVYFGTRAQYTNGCRFKFNYSEKKGMPATVIIGRTIINEKNLSVPVNGYDATAEGDDKKYTIWCNITKDGEIPAEVAEDLKPKEDGKKPIAAFVFSKIEEEKEGKKLIGLSGSYDSYLKVS